MNAEAFLQIAQQLLKLSSEAAYRTAASRAYYALFHRCVALLSGLGFDPADGPQAHGQLQGRINNAGVSECQQLYRMLHRLDDRRRLADYDLHSQEFHSQATVALLVASAGQGIAVIESCEKSPELRRLIRGGMQAYESRLKSSES
ncbi:MAG: hypothetical protein DKINENOH_05051 [bacterium]|nr:hypothetical protein [bacterium]